MQIPANKWQSGFTLIELMIAVGIVGVLASLALPEYSEYVRESRRGDATSSIQDMMAQQALYYGNYRGTYTDDVTDLGFIATDGNDTMSSNDGNYTVQLSACPGSNINDCVLIQATASSSSQLDDLTCRTITLNSRGTQFAQSYDPDSGYFTNSEIRATCWN